MKKEQEQYAERLEKRPPEGLIPWLLEHKWFKKEYLIYRAGFETDYMTDLKTKVVNAVCTACGSSMVLDYAAGPACASYAPAPFGFMTANGETHISGNNLLCPCCGTEVTARHIGSFRETITDDAYPLTFGRLDDKLVIYCWCIRRVTDKDGKVRFEDWPYEAYVCEQKKLVRLVGYNKNFYFASLSGEWKQRQRLSDGIDSVVPTDFMGDIGAAIEGTTMQNSKLDLYMNLKTDRFPISYLAVYAKHPNVENLLTYGCGEMVAKAIQNERGYYSSYSYSGAATWKCPQLSRVNWKETKPLRMLGLTKEELQQCIRCKLDLTDIGIVKDLKKTEPVTMEDIALIGEFGAAAVLTIKNACENIRGNRTVMRCLRYLNKQNKTGKDKNRRCTERDLSDYWRMSAACGYDMTDDAVLFPKDLRKEHDRIHKEQQEAIAREAAERLAKEIAERAPNFEKRRAALAPLEFHEGDYLIRPCTDEPELIREGKILNHCVGGYAKSICAGTSAIFFIRKESSPDEPFFTLEFDEKNIFIRQNRGKKNCDPKEDVKQFANDWLAWVKETLGKPKRKAKIA